MFVDSFVECMQEVQCTTLSVGIRLIRRGCKCLQSKIVPTFSQTFTCNEPKCIKRVFSTVEANSSVEGPTATRLANAKCWEREGEKEGGGQVDKKSNINKTFAIMFYANCMEIGEPKIGA